MAIQTGAEFGPRYFLLRVPKDDGRQYMVCEAVVAVNEDALPDGVRSEIEKEFTRAARAKPVEVCELPQPGEGSSWMALQAFQQVVGPSR